MFIHYLKRRLKIGECFLGHTLEHLILKNLFTTLNSAKSSFYLLYIRQA